MRLSVDIHPIRSMRRLGEICTIMLLFSETLLVNCWGPSNGQILSVLIGHGYNVFDRCARLCYRRGHLRFGPAERGLSVVSMFPDSTEGRQKQPTSGYLLR